MKPLLIAPINTPKAKYSINKNSPTKKLYMSQLMISLIHGGRVEVIKDRYNMEKYIDPEDLTLDETVDACMTIICYKLFNGRMAIFQEGLKKNLKYKILKMIEKEK